MRILGLTNLYPNPYQPHRAPFNRHWFRLLGRKHALRIVSPIAWTDEFQARRRGSGALPAGRQVEQDGLVVDHPRYFFSPRVGRRWYGHFYLACVRRTFRRVASELCPDLIYATWAYPDGWAAARMARLLGIPTILQVHGSDVRLLDRFPARRMRTAQAIRAADGIVTPSAELASQVIELGAERSRVRIVYDGVDQSIFYPGSKENARAELSISDGEPILLFIGNLFPVKAVDVLIKACALLREQRFWVRLFIIGQGPLRGALETLARRLGIGDAVQFKSAIPQRELAKWYRAADRFVLPSHSEGLPNVLLEANACGIPWVASNVGGISEIPRPGGCRLVPPGQPAALARAICESLLDSAPGNPDTGPRCRTAAIAELDQFLSEVMHEFRLTTGPKHLSGALT